MAAMRNPAISAPRLAGRTDITEATHGQPVHGPASCHPPPHLTRWRAVTGAASKGVLPAALTATKPGCRPRRRPIYRVHAGRMRRNDRRNGLTGTDIACLRLPACHQRR